MKNSLLLLIIGLFLSHISFARIWRVNNAAGVTASFNSLQTAHDGAAAGDTLHLESSPNSYGGLTCSKKLTIIGTGYFLDENTGLQALTGSAKVDGINFNVGSEGSVIMGCDFQANNINLFCSGITIKRNKFSSFGGNAWDYYVGGIYLNYQSNNSGLGVNDIVITQNFSVAVIGTSRVSTGLLITNNLISRNGYEGDGTGGICVDLHPSTVAILQNNIFRRGRVNVYGCSITNNVMVAGSFTGTGNLVSNNLGNGTQFATGNGNQQNVDMAAVFVGSGTGISTDGAYKLKAGSPALAAGYGSTQAVPVDAGIYGGNFPYAIAGLPPVPSVYFYENQPIGSNSDPIDVNLKVRSNN